MRELNPLASCCEALDKPLRSFMMEQVVKEDTGNANH